MKHDYYSLGKFSSARDEILHSLSLDGFNESSGESEAPTGWFSRMSITSEEIDNIREQITSDDNFSALTDFDFDLLIGNFLLRESDNGSWSVETFDTEIELLHAYGLLEIEYVNWSNGHESEI